jgi:hypothetical protein
MDRTFIVPLINKTYTTGSTGDDTSNATTTTKRHG